MSLKLDGNISPNLLLIGILAGAGVYLVWKIGTLGDSFKEYSAGDTFADNWEKYGDTVPFTPMWWTNRVTDAYNAIPQGSLDPSSDQNIVYQGVNSVVQKLPGASKDETLGTYLYNLFND